LYSGSFNPHDKDQREYLGSKILINLDEMATLTRTDIETLKSAMSERYVVLRRAYGRAPIHLFRRASFCGSNNDDAFLTDQTGNRRWLPFAIHDIDINEEFDIGLLYAQALKMCKNKDVKLWLDKQDIAEFEERNEEFRFVPMEEQLILAHFCQPTKEEILLGSGVEFYQTSELLHKIASMEEYKKMNVNDTSLKRMGKALKALGFSKKGKRFPEPVGVRDVWIVKRINWSEVKEPEPASGDKDLF
jgi:predicted P-loop ATPase